MSIFFVLEKASFILVIDHILAILKIFIRKNKKCHFGRFTAKIRMDLLNSSIILSKIGQYLFYSSPYLRFQVEIYNIYLRFQVL